MTRISDSLPERQFGLTGPTTPCTQRLPAITRTRFGLFRFRSPLLTESRLLSLPVGTEMFHFPTFPPHALCVQAWVTGDESSRVSPFGNPRITVWLPTHRGLSQAPTSFIGSWCQGIHRMPLKTWLQITKMLASTVQFSSYGRSRPSCRRLPKRLRRYIGVDWFVPRRCGLVPVPSGLNSVLGPLHRSVRGSVPGEPGRTDEHRDSEGQLVNVPPLSTVPDTCDQNTGLDAGPAGARCSLERR